MIIFGPVPSRRLGQSLGINNIPPKKCSYSCVYCQLGRTNRLQIKREEFYEPQDIFKKVAVKIEEIKDQGGILDYLTFVCDGEPTLDGNLGTTIDLLKQFGIKIAIITNASLLWLDKVREDLAKADWVSLKTDTVDKDIWRRINRSHGRLELDKILSGSLDFAKGFKGTLVTETMLVAGYNDHRDSLRGVGRHIAKLNPAKAYLLVPTRPPAEGDVGRPPQDKLRKAFWIISELAENTEVECVTGDEGERFFVAEDPVKDLLSILAVHPIKEKVMQKLLKDRNIDWQLIDNLLMEEEIEEYNYEGVKFYKRKIL